MRKDLKARWHLALAMTLLVCHIPMAFGAGTWKAGCSKVKITPTEPVWMAGYAFRTHPSEGVRQDIWAKALALEDASGRLGVIVTMDLLSVPKDFSDALRDRLASDCGLERSRIILNVSHTHSGPVIGRALEFIYPMGDGDWKAVDAYTEWLQSRLVALVKAALAGMEPALVSTGNGLARFAVNRRNNKEKDMSPMAELKGPFDHSVPVLKVTTPSGDLRAVLFGYACHNTVISDYLIGGDYAGYAQEEIERAYPGAVAMFFQGAGGDQNPMPRRKVSYARQYGGELASAVCQVLSEEMEPQAPILEARYMEVALPLEQPLNKEEFDALGKGSDYQARWARGMLSFLEGGGTFIHEYPFPLQFWRVGNQNIFALGGELVCGYALDIKELYGSGSFVMGYCNDVMSYIPTPVIWDEGGYEGAVAHRVYALPSRWTRDVHDRIMCALRTLVPVEQ